MKSFAIAIFACFLFLFSNPSYSESFSFKKTDKLLHVSASYALTFTTTKLLEKKIPKWKSILYAGLMTVALGTAKEIIIDDRYSSSDQLGNFIGVVGSTVVIVSFDL